MAGLLAPMVTPGDSTAADRGRVSAFCDLFYRQKRVREAFETYVAPDYIQHSAGIAQGREAAIVFLTPMFARDGFTLVPVRIMLDADIATVVLDVTAGAVRAVVIDLFRLKDGLIVEHWDVKGEMTAEVASGYFTGFAR